MNILIVTQDFPPATGGIQMYVFELARRFLARGHRVTVACPGNPSDPSPLPEANVIRFRIHSSWLFLPLLFRLRGILREGGYTHVLYAQWQAAIPELALPRAARAHRAFALVHGREILSSIFGPLHRALCRRVFSRLDVAVPNSRAVRDLTFGRIGDACPLRVVHPAVDPDLFRPAAPGPLRALYGLPADAPVILCMARMVKRKNMEGVLRAFPAVLRAFPEARLVLAGDGPERKRLERLAKSLGCAGQVVFPGMIRRHDAHAREHGGTIYSLADVFAMPCLGSERDVEGFGIVYLEAGACGIPVVGSRVGGIPDAVAEGETGLLVDPAKPEELEAALVDLLRRPDRGRSLGVAARARILRELTWEATGDRMLAILEAP